MKIFVWAFLCTMVVSALLLGFAVYRSNQFPKPAIVLIVLGALTSAIGAMASVFLALGGVILFSIGGLLIGMSLWRPSAASLRSPTAA